MKFQKQNQVAIDIILWLLFRQLNKVAREHFMIVTLITLYESGCKSQNSGGFCCIISRRKK